MQVASSVERAGGRIALAHTVEVLDASIRGSSVESLGVSATSGLDPKTKYPVRPSSPQ